MELKNLLQLVNNMWQYLRVYKTLLKLNFSVIIAYRANFINSIISTCFWGGFQIIWVLLLTAKINTFYNWSREELILISANYVFIIGLFHLIFSRNFDRFSLIIDRGELDFFLLKPIDSQFLLSFWRFNYANVFRIIIGAGIIIYLLDKMHVAVGLINLTSYIILVIFSLVLMYSIWLFFSTLMIWSPRLSNITALLYNINGISRFPPEMIYELKNFILLFLVPFTLMSAIPTKALFQKALSGDVVLLICLAFLVFFLSRKFWKFALRYYTSASN